MPGVDRGSETTWCRHTLPRVGSEATTWEPPDRWSEFSRLTCSMWCFQYKNQPSVVTRSLNHSLLNPLTNLLTEICEFTVSQLPMNIDIAQDINCDQSSVGCFLRTGSGISQLLGNAEFISELKCQLMDSIIETRLRVHRKVLFYLVTRLRINLHPRYWALALSTALPASIPILKLTLVDFSNQAPCRPVTNFRSPIDCTTLVVLPLTMLLTPLPMLHRWVMCGVRSGRKNSFRWRRRRQRSNLSKKWFQRSWLLALPFKKRVQAFGYQSWNHLYLQWKLSRGKSQCVCLISRV